MQFYHCNGFPDQPDATKAHTFLLITYMQFMCRTHTELLVVLILTYKSSEIERCELSAGKDQRLDMQLHMQLLWINLQSGPTLRADISYSLSSPLHIPDGPWPALKKEKDRMR